MRIMGIKILSGGIIKGSGGCGIRTSMTTILLICYIYFAMAITKVLVWLMEKEIKI